MKKIFMLVVIMLVVSGCEHMTNDEVIAAVKKCEQAGMKPIIYNNGFTNEARHVNCIIKER